jgi:pyruvate,orthophosphate dikinase
VFGNLGETSGTGVAFTRDPASGKMGAYGDYLADAQGEDVVAGIRSPLSLDDLAAMDKASHRQLIKVMCRLETHYRDLCDIEFTIERGKLWLLQTRVGKRGARCGRGRPGGADRRDDRPGGRLDQHRRIHRRGAAR